MAVDDKKEDEPKGKYRKTEYWGPNGYVYNLEYEEEINKKDSKLPAYADPFGLFED